MWLDRARSGWISGALVAVLAAAGGGCVTPPPTTHVARNELARSGDATLDLFFRDVHSMQLALNESPRMQLDVLADLAAALGITPTADLETCASAVRARVQRIRDAGGSVQIVFDPRIESPIGLPQGTERAGVFPPPQEMVAAQVSVPIDSSGSLPPGADAQLSAVRRAVASAVALKWRLDAIARFADDLHQTGERFRGVARAHGVEDELRDALDFLDGAAARARAQSQSSLQIAVRVQAAANLSS